MIILAISEKEDVSRTFRPRFGSSLHCFQFEQKFEQTVAVLQYLINVRPRPLHWKEAEQAFATSFRKRYTLAC